jgi:MFS family permease
MAFDQIGINMLMPFIKPALHLKNIQVGLLASVYWAVFAISSFVVSSLAESKGKRKSFLVMTLLLFSLFSIVPAFSTSFRGLLAARSIMALLEGPILPLCQSIIALESPIERRGAHMGIVGNLGGPLLGLFVAPLVLVRMASTYGWRSGLFVVAVPGLLCALLVACCVSEPKTIKAGDNCVDASQLAGGRLAEVLRFRNVYLCAVLCCCAVAYLDLAGAFYPLFYVNVRQFSPQQMSFLMALLGVSSALFGVLLPTASDRFGRKPVMVISSLLGIVCPLIAIYFLGPIATLAVLLFVGWAFTGSGSVFMSTIPSETVPARSISTAMGLIIALGTIVGGLVGPAIAGWSADHWGLRAPLILQAGCAVGAVLAAMALRETAPRKTKSPAKQLASA